MYNLNKCGINTIILATLAAFIVANCMDEDDQDRWGNIILLIGQILVTLPVVGGKCCCNREVNDLGDCGCRNFDNFNSCNY